jgi:hypothetical protein
MVGRLSGWQRLGLVLTLVWFGGLVCLNRLWVTHQAEVTYSIALQACLGYQDVTERLGCSQAADVVFNSEKKPRWGRLLTTAAWPIPLFWMLGWLVIVIGRWVRDGFQNDHSRRR